MGQGGKASLANTADADILEYILAKLAARIAANSRTFLVKVKAHRGEPLNEGADDLAEAGRAMEKEGENSRWQERTTRAVYPYYDRNLGQWKKGTWTKADEAEVEKSFWLSRPDGWVINRKTKKIILLEFKRTSNTAEAYFQVMRKVAEKQHTPILTGLRDLAEERGWEVAVVPLVAGQRSVREKEWLEALRIFGIGKEDGQRIIGRLGRTLLDEHEKLFASYWRHTFGPSSTLLQLLVKGRSVRTSRPPQGG